MNVQIEKNKLVKYEGNEEEYTIPQEVEIIGDYAFYNALNLKRIHIGSQVKEIGSNAFYHCESLEEVIVPDSVYYMDSAVFSRCISLKKVVLSKQLSIVPKITFFQCENLEEVVLPSRVFKIERSCFEQCHSLKNIVLPDTLKVLEDNVFDDCTSLREIVLPSNMTTLGNNVFFNCSSLRKVNIPASIKTIGKGAFESRGKISITSDSDLMIKAEMMDNNWNMYWNFGSNKRWNGKNEDNYQLVNSYLPLVELNKFKPVAQCVLAVNYLETYRKPISYYDEWILAHTDDLLEKIVVEGRYSALDRALDCNLIDSLAVEPYLNRIEDRAQRAKLLNRRTTKKIDDLFDLL